MADSKGIAALTKRVESDYSPEAGLHRRLTERQLSMIAIGGAIGVGLFLGTSISISLAGPGLIITYLLGAVIAVVVAYVIAEMAVVHPAAGSFGVYAEKYLHPWAGFVVRATYGIVQIIAIGAEVTAVAIYFAFWLARGVARTAPCHHQLYGDRSDRGHGWRGGESRKVDPTRYA